MPCGTLCSATQTGSNSIASLVGFVKRISQKITIHHRHRLFFGVTDSDKLLAAERSVVWLLPRLSKSSFSISLLTPRMVKSISASLNGEKTQSIFPK